MAGKDQSEVIKPDEATDRNGSMATIYHLRYLQNATINQSNKAQNNRRL